MINTTHERIALCVHKKPDGDAIGALIALRRIFLKQGKEVFILSDFKDSPNGNFSLKLKISKELEKQAISSEELPEHCHLYLLDHSHRNYSLAKYWRLDKFVACTLIDHHYESKHDDIEHAKTFRDVSKCSCCEIIFDGLIENKQEELIDSEVAYGLALGFVCDTANFRYGFTFDRLDKLHKLIYKFKALEFSEELPVGNKGTSYRACRRLDGAIRFCSTKDSSTQTIYLKLNNEQYKRYLEGFEKNYRHICLLQEELIQTRYTKCLIVSFESSPNFGTLRFITNDKRISEFLYERGYEVFTNFGFSRTGIKSNQIEEHEKKLKAIIKECRDINPDGFDRLDPED